jgi:hypothetical protein
MEKKYAINVTFSPRVVIRKCNEILNVCKTQMNEFVHHMVEFFIFEVFHCGIIIFIEQVLNPKHFASTQNNDVKFFPSSV